MPFDPIKPETVAIPRFQKVADAILIGCSLTDPSDGDVYEINYEGGRHRACVWSAMHVGFSGIEFITTGTPPAQKEDRDLMWSMDEAYEKRYGHRFIWDFIEKRLTREQIAARIAAL